MTRKDTGRSSEAEEWLRQEASAWFARMRREDAGRFKAEFDAWLADPAHLGAYNRIAERFSNAKVLRTSTVADETSMSAGSCGWRRVLLPSVAVLVLGAIALFLAFSMIGALIPGRSAPGSATVQYATVRGEIREIRLADGSRVTLDTDSLLAVSFASEIRRLRLERGRARFDVAHEHRPFVVAAGERTVTARGTVFDVAVADDRSVHVALLKGAVDVALPKPKAAIGGRSALRRLRPGEEVAYGAHAIVNTPRVSLARDASWPEAMIDFDDTPLTEIVARANRYSATRLTLGDPSLGALRASGRFRINDPDRLSANLASVFDLQVDRNVPGEIILRPRP